MSGRTRHQRPSLGLTLLESRDCPKNFSCTTVEAFNAAIIEANSNEQDDTIKLTKGVYNLTSALGGTGNGLTPITGDPDQQERNHTLTINGNGSTISRNSDESFRIFRIQSGGFLYLNDVTLENGSAPEGQSGGAILVQSSSGIDARNGLFINNNANLGGGAIAFEAGSNGGFLFNSTFSGNSNFHGNDNGGGGAIFISAGSSKVLIGNCTIADNANFPSVVEGNLSSYGGGIRANGKAELSNTIVYGNTENEISASDLATDAPIEANFSIVGEYGSLVLPGNHAFLDTNPQLRPLANNGGQSQTYAFIASSPARDHGSNNLAPPLGKYDQRGVGFKRIAPGNGTIDIGAYEYVSNTKLTIRSSVNPSRVGQTVTFTAQLTSPIQGVQFQGDVVFKISGKVIGTVKVDASGKATITHTFLTRGKFNVVAEFSDAENLFDPSTAALVQTVGRQGRRW